MTHPPGDNVWGGPTQARPEQGWPRPSHTSVGSGQRPDASTTSGAMRSPVARDAGAGLVLWVALAVGALALLLLAFALWDRPVDPSTVGQVLRHSAGEAIHVE